jgi:hypothetical protein
MAASGVAAMQYVSTSIQAASNATANQQEERGMVQHTTPGKPNSIRIHDRNQAAVTSSPTKIEQHDTIQESSAHAYRCVPILLKRSNHQQ